MVEIAAFSYLQNQKIRLQSIEINKKTVFCCIAQKTLANTFSFSTIRIIVQCNISLNDSLAMHKR